MNDEERRREAEAALERVRRDSETIGASSMARVGEGVRRRVGDHFTGRDGTLEEAADPAEVWGRRIGRGLSVLGVLALTYWLGLQLRWW